MVSPCIEHKSCAKDNLYHRGEWCPNPDSKEADPLDLTCQQYIRYSDTECPNQSLEHYKEGIAASIEISDTAE